MKRLTILAFLLLNLPVLAQQASVPAIEYSSVPNFLKLPPDRYLGEVAGVAVNSKGHVFVLLAATLRVLHTARPQRSCWSLVGTANLCARSATICTPGPLGTR